MNLGILKVAAVLERSSTQVDMIDFSGITNYLDAMRDYCFHSDTQIFGITATTPQLPAAMQIVQAIRSVKPKARIILGGPHITLVNAAAKLEKKRGRLGRGTTALEQLTGDFD